MTKQNRGRMLKGIAKPGDLVFYRVTPKSGLMSWLIAIFQALRHEGYKYNYSHVAIVGDDTKHQIEAVFPRIRSSKIDWECSGLELYRIRRMGAIQRSRLLETALKQVGKWYDVGMALGALFDIVKAEICTTLVIKCAAAAGIKLGLDAGSFVGPNELALDKRVFRIG